MKTSIQMLGRVFEESHSSLSLQNSIITKTMPIYLQILQVIYINYLWSLCNKLFKKYSEVLNILIIYKVNLISSIKSCLESTKNFPKCFLPSSFHSQFIHLICLCSLSSGYLFTSSLLASAFNVIFKHVYQHRDLSLNLKQQHFSDFK